MFCGTVGYRIQGSTTVDSSGDRTAAAPSGRHSTTASLAAPVGRVESQPPIRGRDALIDRLYDVVAGNVAQPRVHLLHGLSGSGKTAVALKVAQRAELDGIEVWWVKADDEPTLQEHMRALSLEVGVAATDLQAGHPADHLWRALKAQPRRWLLVIDNADDHEVLAAGTGRLDDGRGWVRRYRDPLGTVLVLSRFDLDYPIGWWEPHPVGMLDEATAIEVLADHIPIEAEDRPAAAELAVRLGHLPLALRLAGAYLQESRYRADRNMIDAPITIRGYLSAIDADGLALEQPPSSSAVRRFVDRPWSMSIELLERRDPPFTITLLRLMSYLANFPVPLGDLVDCPGLDRIGLPGEQLSESLKSLKSLALVEEQFEPATGARLVLHPLVRDATRRRFPPTQADVVALVALVRGCRTLRGPLDDGPVPEDSQQWPAWQALTPHVMHLVRVLLEDLPPGQPADVVRDACYAGNYAARSMQGRGLYAAADIELRRIERLAVRELDPEDPETLRCRHIRAVVLHVAGRVEEALHAYDEMYRLRLRVLGADDRETIRSRHYRALTLHELGRYDEALPEYEAVLKDRIRVAGPYQRHTLATRHNIARLLHDTGRLLEAERQYRELLEDQRREMGPDYRHTLATRHNLALCLHAQGRLDEAQAEYDDIVDIECRILGPLHPDTLATRANRAMVLAAQGHAAAEAELQEVYEAQCRVLGANHPETIATRERRVHNSTRPGPL